MFVQFHFYVNLLKMELISTTAPLISNFPVESQVRRQFDYFIFFRLLQDLKIRKFVQFVFQYFFVDFEYWPLRCVKGFKSKFGLYWFTSFNWNSDIIT